MKTAGFKNVTPVSRPYDDPVPPEVKDLDLITFFFAYHVGGGAGGDPRRDPAAYSGEARFSRS